MSRQYPALLETVSVMVPEAATEAYEAALASACASVGFFLDQATGAWRIEGVKDVGTGDDRLTAALALAETLTGVTALLERHRTPAEGWLARTHASFPEQHIGRRFAVRGSHIAGPAVPGRITLMLDAGLAFGSGEHGSTRGCLRALEHVPYRRPRRVLDMGTGSGILAMGAAHLLRRRVLATDIEPWSVRVAQQNARLNQLSHLVKTQLADGWRSVAVRRRGPYDLVFANILARPLCAMACDLAANLAPGGTAILSGLLNTQVPWVLSAHRRRGLRLERRLTEGVWATLVLRR
jgi:ribosomal protein L11 methyltransferase